MPLFDHAQPKNFRSTFNFCECVATPKKWGYFIDFGPYLRNKVFSSIRLVKEHSNINFRYRKNLVKINLNSIFFKLKRPYFWFIFGPFPQFLEQKFFPKTHLCHPHLCHAQLHKGLYRHAKIDPIPRKHPDRQQDRMTDTPYFIRSFWLPLGV